MSKIKLALVGAGVIGRRHLLASRSIDHIQIVGIADPFPAARSVGEEHECPVFSSIHELLENTQPDGVIVATPTEHHLDPTLQALQAGAHVLVEKPIMANLDECEQTIEAARAAGKQVLVAHQRRYYKLVTTARELVQQGELGQLVSVSGQWTMRKPLDYYQADWRKKWQAGPILTNLIHDMDLLRFIVGDVASITAEAANNVLNYEKEDVAGMVLRFTNGAIGTFLLSDQSHSPWSWEHGFGENALFPPSGQNSMRFMGTKGSLEFPNLTLWKTVDGDSCWTNTISSSVIKTSTEDAYIKQLTHFVDVISGDETPIVSAEDATATLRATLAVYESAESGGRVTLS